VNTDRPNIIWTSVALLLAAFFAVLVVYAVMRDPNAPQSSLAPGPGAVPLPDAPVSTTTTGERVPPPGDRATGTVAGEDVKTAPPPVRPARPLVILVPSGPDTGIDASEYVTRKVRWD
jgi:hypothetical protein